jgi:hypothetical protein
MEVFFVLGELELVLRILPDFLSCFDTEIFPVWIKVGEPVQQLFKLRSRFQLVQVRNFPKKKCEREGSVIPASERRHSDVDGGNVLHKSLQLVALGWHGR